MALIISRMEKFLAYLNAERGRRISLAAALNIAPSAISQWREVPLSRVVAIEAATGIPRSELRPDIFLVEAGKSDA